MDRSIWIGFDRRERDAFEVARRSLLLHLTESIPVHALVLSEVIASGLYRRPIEFRKGAADLSVMWDTLSDAPMSTDHANARFLVSHLADRGWALFMDGDTLARSDVARVFDDLDPAKALYCVQHVHAPSRATKMDGQIQTRYARKNWSSFMIFNCEHPANAALDLDLINRLPGRDLHRFCWLDEDEIGALDPKWNFLVGHSDPSIDPAIVHFTDGVPDMAGYENVAFADEWRTELTRKAA